jgi:Na+/proline symporter
MSGPVYRLSDSRQLVDTIARLARNNGSAWFRTDYFCGLSFLHSIYGLMVGFAIIGMSRVQNSDDFATARVGYGPVFLALAMTATAASGAAHLGLPALAYSAGISSLWVLL